MENKVPPICCGQPAEWVVQSISLSYYFCRVCKQEPGVKKEEEKKPSKDVPPEYYFNGFGASGAGGMAHNGGHNFSLRAQNTSGLTCNNCSMHESDYANHKTPCAVFSVNKYIPTPLAPSAHTQLLGYLIGTKVSYGTTRWLCVGNDLAANLSSWKCLGPCGGNLLEVVKVGKSPDYECAFCYYLNPQKQSGLGLSPAKKPGNNNPPDSAPPSKLSSNFLRADTLIQELHKSAGLQVTQADVVRKANKCAELAVIQLHFNETVNAVLKSNKVIKK